AVLASAALFLAAAPFATVPLAPVWAFIPIYESAMVINDLITAVFLFGQFYISRWRALLLLACGYLFSAAMAVPPPRPLPRPFAPTGLLGAGPQSTAWLYMFWHAGFPLLVIAYALQRGDASATERRGGRPARAIAASAAAVLLAAGAFTLLATAGHEHLPAV